MLLCKPLQVLQKKTSDRLNAAGDLVTRARGRGSRRLGLQGTRDCRRANSQNRALLRALKHSNPNPKLGRVWPIHRNLISKSFRVTCLIFALAQEQDNPKVLQMGWRNRSAMTIHLKRTFSRTSVADGRCWRLNLPGWSQTWTQSSTARNLDRAKRRPEHLFGPESTAA